MTITSYNRTTTAVYDSGFKDSVRTAKYRDLVSAGKLLPENLYRFQLFSGSTPRSNLPTSQGGTLYGWQSKVPVSSCDMFDILIDGNNTGWNRPVTISNGNVPSTPGDSVTWSGFKSVSAQGIEVQNKLVKKLNNRDVDLGVALGEARETAHFVQGAMLSIYRAYRSARRGDASGMLKALKVSQTSVALKQSYRDVLDAASGVWLSYSYAVRPLLADVFGAMSALEKRHSRPDVVTMRARVSSELDKTMATVGAQPGRLDIEWSCKGTLESHMGLSFEIANPFLYTLSQVGLTNPLNVAWELVPFSFVVDWFLPIGAYFDGLVPPQGISNLHGYQSYKGEFHGKGKLTGNFPIPPNTADGSRKFEATWYNRFKGRNPITSYPRYHLVGATFDLGKSQIASGLSLLWSVGAGRKAERKALKEAEKYHNLGTVRDLSREVGGFKAVDWSMRGGANWRA